MIRRLFHSGQADTDQIEAFSDGVLVIVITLLVLEITPPTVPGGDAELWRAVAHLLPMIAAWVVSFLFVLVFWVSHHHLFASRAKVDRGVLWLNGLILCSSRSRHSRPRCRRGIVVPSPRPAQRGDVADGIELFPVAMARLFPR